MTLSNYIPHYTLEDYERWEGDWELWSGVPVAMSPSPGMEHQLLSGRLLRQVSERLEGAGCGDCLVVHDLDWRVANDTVLRPDLQILCGHPPTAFVTETPKMVVEILSDSTRQRDLLYKREIYGKLGVPYYLIVDPRSRQCTLLRLDGQEYLESPTPTVLNLDSDCQIDLDLSGLFSQR